MARSATSRRESGDPIERLFAGDAQPAHRDFHIGPIRARSGPVAVRQHVIHVRPFYRHLLFEAPDPSVGGDILLVPPISGNFAILMRDVVIGLLADFRVHVIDWTNPRHVPLSCGSFGFAENIDAILKTLEATPPGAALLGLCQAGVPALAATALLAAGRARRAPSVLVLVGAPIDPDAAPTPVVDGIRARSSAWYRRVALWPVHRRYAGKGRVVYPAWMQLSAIATYILHRSADDTEIARKLAFDDGADPQVAPFLDLCTSVMDIDGSHFMENLDLVFRDPRLPRGAFYHHGAHVDPGAIRQTALMTVEGGQDDVAAPGQTAAAHCLCRNVPEEMRLSFIDPGSGHFSLFHGRRWRNVILPELRSFLQRNSA